MDFTDSTIPCRSCGGRGWKYDPTTFGRIPIAIVSLPNGDVLCEGRRVCYDCGGTGIHRPILGSFESRFSGRPENGRN